MRYWLVGASDDQVHVLKSDGTDALKHVGSVRLATANAPANAAGGAAASGAAASGAAAPAVALAVAPSAVGISSLALLHPALIDQEPLNPRQPPEPTSILKKVALCAGFSDGSLRQYSVADLLAQIP